MLSIHKSLQSSTIEPVLLGSKFQESKFSLPIHLVEGGVAALDLINGHLRTNDDYDDKIPYDFLGYEPFLHNSEKVITWQDKEGQEYDNTPFVLKVQPFSSGGYEAIIYKVKDLGAIGRMMDGEIGTGKREEGERKENDVISSKNRAKKMVRLRIKSMGCDRLLTLTVRQSEEDQWTVEQWAAAWKKFIRICKKAGSEINYVCVLERHKKGGFHLHAAIVGRANIKLMRGIWWSICGGRGQGNIDISFKPGISDHKRRAGLARYVSKYITKQDNAEFNKKRYWSSRHNLPACVRYVLSADSIIGALVEVAGLRGLDSRALVDSAFIFKTEQGAWFSFDECLCIPIPF